MLRKKGADTMRKPKIIKISVFMPISISRDLDKLAKKWKTSKSKAVLSILQYKLYRDSFKK